MTWSHAFFRVSPQAVCLFLPQVHNGSSWSFPCCDWLLWLLWVWFHNIQSKSIYIIGQEKVTLVLWTNHRAKWPKTNAMKIGVLLYVHNYVFLDFSEILRSRNCDLRTTHHIFWGCCVQFFACFPSIFLDTPVQENENSQQMNEENK